MQNYVHRGKPSRSRRPTRSVPVVASRSGNIFGVAVNTQVQGDSMEAVVSGVFDLAKDASTFSQGDLVYWDDTNKVGTSTVGANLLIGSAEKAQLTGDGTVRVKLFGVPGFSGQVNGVKVAHALYDFTVDGGTSCTPTNSDTIPANAVVFGGVVNSTVAVTAAGAATVAIGTAAGSAGNSIPDCDGQGFAVAGRGSCAYVRSHAVQDVGSRQDQRYDSDRAAHRRPDRSLGAVRARQQRLTVTAWCCAATWGRHCDRPRFSTVHVRLAHY